MHTVFIVTHALAATVALVAAVVAMRGRHRAVRVLVPSLTLMELGLVGAIVAAWGRYGGPLQIVFTALLILGAAVVYRGVQVARHAPHGSRPDPVRQWSALVFVTVALVDAFLVVLVLDLGGPDWALVATGVVVAVVGHIVLERQGPHRRRRETSSDALASSLSGVSPATQPARASTPVRSTDSDQSAAAASESRA